MEVPACIDPIPIVFANSGFECLVRRGWRVLVLLVIGMHFYSQIKKPSGKELRSVTRMLVLFRYYRKVYLLGRRQDTSIIRATRLEVLSFRIRNELVGRRVATCKHRRTDDT